MTLWPSRYGLTLLLNPLSAPWLCKFSDRVLYLMWIFSAPTWRKLRNDTNETTPVFRWELLEHMLTIWCYSLWMFSLKGVPQLLLNISVLLMFYRMIHLTIRTLLSLVCLTSMVLKSFRSTGKVNISNVILFMLYNWTVYMMFNIIILRALFIWFTMNNLILFKYLK